MRRLSLLGLLTLALIHSSSSVMAQIPCFVGTPCVDNNDCRQAITSVDPPMPPCLDCVCNLGSNECTTIPTPVGTKCDLDNNACTMDHCDGSGQCVQRDPPYALDCIPCDADGNECTIDKCDGQGNCLPTGLLAEAGAACDLDDRDCTLDTCDAEGNCLAGPRAPDGHPCGNVCTYRCHESDGSCRPDDNLGTPPYHCPEGDPCEGKDCATTKEETCQLIQYDDPFLELDFTFTCLCIGQYIECCDNADCPNAGGNPCIKCIKPPNEPEEVGGNCECAVGDACLLPGGSCQPDVPGQCQGPTPDQCACEATL